MFDEILTAISLGRRLLGTLSALRKDAPSFRTETDASQAKLDQLDALQTKLRDLEVIAREQDRHMREIEGVLKNSMAATEALARRVGTIFWLGLAGTIVGGIALILSIIALTRAIH